MKELSPAGQSPFLDFSVFTEWVRKKQIFSGVQKTEKAEKRSLVFYLIY